MAEEKHFWQRFAPKQYEKTLMDVDLQFLQEQGIRGIIFDLDNTITPWNEPHISQEVINWFTALRKMGFHACLLSNNGGERVQKAADLLQIEFVCNARKPFKKGYARAMEVLHTKPNETAVIGDQLFTDMWGGNRWGMYTILLEPMAPKEYWFTTNFSRRLEKVAKRRLGLPLEKGIKER